MDGLRIMIPSHVLEVALRMPMLIITLENVCNIVLGHKDYFLIIQHQLV